MEATQRHSPFAYYSRTLVANLPDIVDSTGERIWIKEAAQAFELKLDNGDWFPIEAGRGVALKGGDYFKRIQIRSTVAQTVQFFTGTAEAFQVGLVRIREAQTKAWCQTYTIATSALSAVVAPPAPYNGDIKEVHVSNNSAQLLGIHFFDSVDGSYQPGAAVVANSSYRIPSGVPFKIFNAGAGTASVYVTVFFYTGA